ncbi:hypothetical protein [Intrasporangium sp. YIM S08009]|uniref:hypothetical protein n=1 Tax=Intrasporangium zincisolvens TaxID=3080018 RepID=UPI002B05F6CD|nr:hypothetical protein [Intrasporangium sp. YIM S08009]
MSHFDPELKDVLERRSEGVHVVADLAERAIRRDAQLRRRRAAAVGVAAAFVLAVGVPVGWAALGPTPDRTVPVAPSTTRPTDLPTPSVPVMPPTSTSPTPTSTPTLTADGSPAPANLRPATGDPTAATDIPYLAGGVIHDGTKEHPLGSSVSRDYLATLPGGRWLVQRAKTGDYQVLQPLDLPTMQLGSGKATVAADGQLIVIERLGTLRVYDGSGTWVRTLPASACDCAVSGSGGSSPGFEAVGVIDGVVYANRGFRGDAVAWDILDNDVRPVKHRLALVDAATGTALVAPDPNKPSTRTCHDLVDLASDRTRWRLCGPLLFRSFSADGQYLLATGEIDGLDDSQLNPDRSFTYGGLVVVRTSDASVVLEGRGDVATGVGSPVSYRMGADGTITVQVGSTGGTRSLQRCTLDGSCEVVGRARPRDQVDIPEGDDPYVISAD